MKGIWFKEVFCLLLLITFLLYSLAYLIFEMWNVNNKINETEKKTLDKQRMKRDRIAILIMLVMLFFTSIGGIYWIIKKKIIVLALAIVALSFLYSTVMIITTIYEFVKYILKKKEGYKLTGEKENTLWLTGGIALVGCSFISEKEFVMSVSQWTGQLSNYQKDILEAGILILWYFAIQFFTSTFLMLTVNKVIKMYRKNQKQPRKKKKVKNEKENESKEYWSEAIWIWVEKNVCPRKEKKWFKYLIWVIGVVLESFKKCILAWIGTVIEPVESIVVKFPKWLWKNIKKLLRLLEGDLDKVIIITSRISLVISFLMVYLVDTYDKVLSDKGGEAYEFVCSVILIPFFIAQLEVLREKSKV